MEDSDLRALAALIRGRRAAALGTLLRGEGAPYVSLALFAEQPDFSSFVLRLSRLALHTRNLQADPRAALMIAEPDAGAGDPQTLARVSLQAEAAVLAKDSSECSAARAVYLRKFPDAAQVFELGDFEVYRLVPRAGRFIAAFGRILNLTADHLRLAGEL